MQSLVPTHYVCNKLISKFKFKQITTVELTIFYNSLIVHYYCLYVWIFFNSGLAQKKRNKMPEPENKESDKEKETAKQDEKEKVLLSYKPLTFLFIISNSLQSDLSYSQRPPLYNNFLCQPTLFIPPLPVFSRAFDLYIMTHCLTRLMTVFFG